MIDLVVGAKPNYIQAFPLYEKLQEVNTTRIRLINTGQHFDENMSKIFFEQLGAPKPDINLEVGSGTHGAQTARIIERIERVFMDKMPSLVIVFGDVNSTVAAALVASKLHIPIAHVEEVGIMITKFKIKCRLSIVGGYHTNREKIIKNLILKYGINKDVEFTGHLSLDKLYEYYKKADCFVFPSRWEGSPRAIKEALAFNLPVVAVDIPGNRLIDKNGMLIHYVKKQIPYDYSRKIIQALSERRKNTINLMKKFNPNFIAQKNYNFYKKVITSDNQ